MSTRERLHCGTNECVYANQINEAKKREQAVCEGDAASEGTAVQRTANGTTAAKRARAPRSCIDTNPEPFRSQQRRAVNAECIHKRHSALMMARESELQTHR